jgi:hypothetical protein
MGTQGLYVSGEEAARQDIKGEERRMGHGGWIMED